MRNQIDDRCHFRLAPDQLDAHALILGASGSGKSTTMLALLAEHIGRGGPAIAIDLSKSPEVRELAEHVVVQDMKQQGGKLGVPYPAVVYINLASQKLSVPRLQQEPEDVIGELEANGHSDIEATEHPDLDVIDVGGEIPAAPEGETRGE